MDDSKKASSSSKTASDEFSIWDFFDQKISHVQTVITPTTSLILTVRQYTELPYISRNCDPLSFWKDKKSTFPELYELHAKYLCIPATSVPCERVF